MLRYVVRELASPHLVARFQRWCGVEQVVAEKEPATAFNSHDRSPAEDNNHTATPLPSSHVDIKHRHHTPVCADGPGSNSPLPLPCGNGTAANGHVHSVVNDSGSDRNLLNHTGDSVANGTGPGSPSPYPTTSSKRNGCLDVSKESKSQRDSYPSASARLQDNCHPPTNSSPCPSPSSRRQPPCDATVGKTDCDRVAFSPDNPSEVQDTGKEGGPGTRLVIRYPFLYYWARLGATLGNEEFYLTGMPFLLWAVDAAVVRQTAVLWWAVMCLGQGAKDYLGWPRPPSPPVVRLETKYLAEFSMPSTHAMAGTAIPMLLAKLLMERYELPAVAVVGVALLWCTTTCLSRLYLGVHTVLDVVCGVVLAVALFLLLSPIIPHLDHLQQTRPWAPVVLLAASLALCTVCYPSGGGHSAKSDVIIITAVLVGAGTGAWLNYHLGLSRESPRPMPMPMPVPTLGWLVVSLVQLVTGVAVVLLLKVALKPVTLRLFRALFRLGRRDPLSESVVVGYRYTTYLCLGLAMTWLDPLLFTALGFGRPGYYDEVV